MLKTFKLFALIISIFSLNLNSFGQEKFAQTVKPKYQKKANQKNDLKVLAQGQYSKIDAPFVFIARDAKTYSQLQNLVDGLPPVSSIDFKKNAVVAGFAGERPTGGFSVEIKKNDKKYLVEVTSPDKDSMVMQVITAPFKVISIPLKENETLNLDISSAFLKNTKTFQVKKGDFEYSGGIAGIRKSFKVNGTIKMLNFGEYSTAFFDLKGMGKDNKRILSEVATGTFKGANLEFFRLDAGNFVQTPNPPFSVKGTLNGKNLSLIFSSLPGNFADGFSGKGTLMAAMIE